MGRHVKFLPFIVAVVLTAGCGDAVKVSVESGPTLQDAWLSSDPDGTSRVTTFGPTDTVHVKADLVHAEAGIEVAAKLVAVKVDHPDVPADTEIGSFQQTYDGKLNRMNFDFSNDGPMPPGSYQVDLSIDGQPAKSLSFTIPAANTQ